MKKRAFGFTLLEILISMSILITITGIITKALFDFSRTAYFVTSQIKSNELLRSTFTKLEQKLFASSSVIYQYNLGTKTLKYCSSCFATTKTTLPNYTTSVVSNKRILIL